MIVRKVEEADKDIFQEYIKTTFPSSVLFDKDVVAKSLVEDEKKRNYIVLDDDGNVIGGGCWSTDGPTMEWAIVKDEAFNLDSYMGLIHKCVTDCLDEGFTFGLIPTDQKWLVTLLQAHFPKGLTIYKSTDKDVPKISMPYVIKVDLQTIVDRLGELAKGV